MDLQIILEYSFFALIIGGFTFALLKLIISFFQFDPHETDKKNS